MLGGGLVFLGIISSSEATSGICVSVKLFCDIHPRESGLDNLPDARDANRGYRLGVRTASQ